MLSLYMEVFLLSLPSYMPTLFSEFIYFFFYQNGMTEYHIPAEWL